MIAERRLRVGERTRSDVAVEAGGPDAGTRRHVEDRPELQTVLRRVRTFDDVDERKIVDVDLGADVAVELLRQRYAVENVVDNAVVPIEMHDAVRTARGAWNLYLHLGEAVPLRQPCEIGAIEHDVAAAALDGRAARNDGVRDLAQRLQT